jgi:hypothetical protein
MNIYSPGQGLLSVFNLSDGLSILNVPFCGIDAKTSMMMINILVIFCFESKKICKMAKRES